MYISTKFDTFFEKWCYYFRFTTLYIYKTNFILRKSNYGSEKNRTTKNQRGNNGADAETYSFNLTYNNKVYIMDFWLVCSEKEPIVEWEE